MDNFIPSYFGYSTYEEYRQNRLDSLAHTAYSEERKKVPTKEEHEAGILEDIERHCGIVISDFNFSRSSGHMVRRNWRHEHPMIFPLLSAEVQEWIRTKTIPSQPVYG